MKIEIWSDVMCPFCYIGKRNLEQALAQFTDSDKLEIVWKSYQLDASVPEKATESYEAYLVKRKGLSATQVQGMLQNVTKMATNAGLNYDFDKAVIVNSRKAHQLIQFAKTHKLGDEMEERLFRAYFTEGKNIADTDTLTQLGVEIGLDANELQAAFTDEQYAYMMTQDIQEARQIGVNGVPFFVFNRKYAVSGAQPPQAFIETLRKSFDEWQGVKTPRSFQILRRDAT